MSFYDSAPQSNEKPYSNEPYVHRTWKNYKGSPTIKIGDIKDVYSEQATRARERFSRSIGNGMTEDKIEEIIKKVTGLYSAWESDAVGKAAENTLLSDIRETVNEMNKSNISKDFGKKNVDGIVKNVNSLNKAFEKQKKVIESIKDVDKRLLEYYRDRVGRDFQSFNTSSVSVGSGFETLAQTSKVNTSLLNWEQNWKEIKKIIASQGPVPKTVNIGKYAKGVKGAKEEYEVTKIISDTIGHLNNVKGEILEAGFAAIVRGQMDNFIKDFKSTGATGLSVSTDGSGYVEDPTLGRKVMKKTDIGLSFSIDDSNITFDVGFSAKAQFKNGPKKPTPFLTSNLGDLLKRADLINTHIEYSLNNLIVHGKVSETAMMRKAIAAHSALTAVGGIDKIDEVYFIVYLDKIITLSDLFNEMSNGTSGSMLNLNLDKFVGKNEAPNKGSYGSTREGRMLEALNRSHYMTQTIRSLEAKVTGRS